MADLEIRDLHVRTEEREILRGVDLDINRGEIHALMGPNGSGKSTLANTLLGHPTYEITEGTIAFKGEDITEAEPHERAKAGLFLAFQYPVSIPGVSVANFLRMAINAKREEPIQVKEFRNELQHAIELLDVDRSFTSRHLNDGFSGGEKKRAEILQMAMLKPDIAILDETDSGLDIDALRTVAEGVQRLHDEQGLGALIITHYQRILHYVQPQFVHILMDGRIVLEGGVELVERLEREGYDQIRQEVGAAVPAGDEDVWRSPASRAAPVAEPVQVKAGRHREATLYHALHGAGAGDGKTSLEQLREQARSRLRAARAPRLEAVGLLDHEPAEPRPGGARAVRPERHRGHPPGRGAGARRRRPHVARAPAGRSAGAGRGRDRRASSSTRSSPSGA